MSIGPISYQPQQAFSGGADFSQLGKLGDVYREGRNRDQLSDLGKRLADGSITYRQAAGEAANMGNMDATLKFLALQTQADELGLQGTAVSNAESVLRGGAPPAGGNARTIAPPPGVAVGPQASAPVVNPAAPNPTATPLSAIPAQIGAAPPDAVAPPAVRPAIAAAEPSPTNTPIATPQGPLGYPRSAEEAQSNIDKLNLVLNNKNLPKTSQDLLSRHLAANLKYLEDKDPAEVRTLEALTKRPDLLATDIARKKATKPETNIITKGEEAESKAQGEAVVKMFEKTASEAGQARAQKANLMQLGDLNQQFQTGGLAALKGAVAGWGIPVGKDTTPIQAYSALIDKMTPGERIPGSGSTSDFDAKMYKRGLPDLIKTPEANTIIRGTHLALADDKIAHADIAQRYLTKQITAKEALAEAKALPDPFAAFKAWKAEQDKPVDVKTRFDASRPSGVAPAAGAQQALEAEARKRGLMQ